MRTLSLSLLLCSLLACSAEARNFYIPVAGAAPGANNTYFRTDIRIFNPSFTRDIDVTIHFCRRDRTTRTSPGRSFTC